MFGLLRAFSSPASSSSERSGNRIRAGLKNVGRCGDRQFRFRQALETGLPKRFAGGWPARRRGRLKAKFLSNWHSPLDSANRGKHIPRCAAGGSCLATVQRSVPRSETTSVPIEKISRYHEGRPMKFRPLHDRVVVKRLEEDTKTAGGIIIPDTVKEKPMRGEVIAVGPGVRDENGKINAPDVKAGDTVLFGKWSGTEVKID